MIPKYSMQTRLILLVLGTVILFGLAAGYASYKKALEETDEIFDAQLAQFAQNMMILTVHSDNDEEHTEPMPPHIHRYQQTLAFQIWNTRENIPYLVLKSDNMSGMTVAQLPVEGFSSGLWQGKHWRYYRLRNEQRGIDIMAGQSDRAREEMAREIAMHNVTPFMFGLPLLAIFSMLAIRLGLRPLRRLEAALRQLSPDQLQPVDMADAPKEIAPVINALNILLRRIATALENERRFTADASHELRTPLAALQAQVQAAKFSGDKAGRDEALAKAFQGAARMAHLVGQLLTLSRLDELSSPSNFDPVNLADLTEESCAELGTDALAKNIEIGFSADYHPELPGSPDMLRILLRNLLDNAIRYTPQGGRVEVVLRLTASREVELEIADSGIGVAEEKLALLGQRFNRITPNAADGVGLGLSIVQRIVEFHHARISFSQAASLGGLCVKVTFPLEHEPARDHSKNKR